MMLAGLNKQSVSGIEVVVFFFHGVNRAARNEIEQLVKIMEVFLIIRRSFRVFVQLVSEIQIFINEIEHHSHLLSYGKKE